MQQCLLYYKMFHSQVVNIQDKSDIHRQKKQQILIKLSTKMKVQNTILNVLPQFVGSPASM